MQDIINSLMIKIHYLGIFWCINNFFLTRQDFGTNEECHVVEGKKWFTRRLKNIFSYFKKTDDLCKKNVRWKTIFDVLRWFIWCRNVY